MVGSILKHHLGPDPVKDLTGKRILHILAEMGEVAGERTSFLEAKETKISASYKRKIIRAAAKAVEFIASCDEPPLEVEDRDAKVAKKRLKNFSGLWQFLLHVKITVNGIQ